LIFQIVLAQELQVTPKKITGDIVVDSGSYATYTLTIKNTAQTAKTVSIRTLDALDWNVAIEPSVSNKVDLKSNEEGVYLLRISEAKREGKYLKTVGVYTLSLIVETNNEKVTLPILINVVSKEALKKNYQPDIITKAELNIKKIDPRNKANVKVYLQNMNFRNNTQVDITLFSSKNLVYQKSTTSLGPLEEKTLDFTLNFKPDESPKTDTLFVKIETLGDDNLTYPKKQPDPIEFEIIPYFTIVRDTKVTSKFMKKITEIKVLNEGNLRQNTEVKFDTNLLDRFFTTTEPKAEFVKDNGNYYYVWKLQLEGKEGSKADTQLLTVTNNYRPLIVIFLTLILLIVFYYVFRSPIIMVKDVAKIHSKEGAIHGLKVIIHLKNRSNRTIENIKVVDKIPSITEIEKDFETGTLKPSSISKGKTSIAVTWEMASLEPWEERIITYHIKSKLSVLGGFDLHHAVARYTKKNGREVVITSNSLDLSKRLIE